MAKKESFVGEVVLSYIRKNELKKISLNTSFLIYEKITEIVDQNTIELYESFYVMGFNNSLNYLGHYLLSKGGHNATLVNIKGIFQFLLKINASHFVIFHNHPSGKLFPSDLDISITKKIKIASDFLELYLIDSIIITKDAYYSFSDEGIL